MVRRQPLGETSEISVGTVAAVLVRLEAAQQAFSPQEHATTDSTHHPPIRIEPMVVACATQLSMNGTPPAAWRDV